MAGAAIKGVSKILRKGLGETSKYGKKVIHPGVKLKSISRYRTDPKTGEKFLNRRATLAGVKAATRLEKPSKKLSTKEKVVLAAAAGYAAGQASGGKKDKEVSAKEKTEKEAKHHYEKSKEKSKNRKNKRGG